MACRGPVVRRDNSSSGVPGGPVAHTRPSATQGQRLKDATRQEVHVLLSADTLDDHLRKRETVIAIHGRRAGVVFQACTGQDGQSLLVHSGVVLESEVACGNRAGQAGRMVQQHSDGDVQVSWVRHDELRKIPSGGGVEIDLPLVDQQHHRSGCVDLADRTDIEDCCRVHRHAVFPVCHGETLGIDYFAAVEYGDSGASGSA